MNSLIKISSILSILRILFLLYKYCGVYELQFIVPTIIIKNYIKFITLRHYYSYIFVRHSAINNLITIFKNILIVNLKIILFI